MLEITVVTETKTDIEVTHDRLEVYLITGHVTIIETEVV